MQITKADMPLVRAYLVREAADYGLYDWQAERFAARRLVRIVKMLASESKLKCDYIVIKSYGNVGSLERSLQLSPDSGWWDWKAGNCEILLCSCGSFSCWGTINFEGPKKWKNGKQ